MQDLKKLTSVTFWKEKKGVLKGRLISSGKAVLKIIANKKENDRGPDLNILLGVQDDNDTFHYCHFGVLWMSTDKKYCNGFVDDGTKYFEYRDKTRLFGIFRENAGGKNPALQLFFKGIEIDEGVEKTREEEDIPF